MEALPATELPTGPDWQYAPKWDGFRCLAFRDGTRVDLMSKAAKPLTRFFPELVASLANLDADKFVLDGEIVVPLDGGLSFDHLLMRIHPAESRIQKLSRETSAVFLVFAGKAPGGPSRWSTKRSTAMAVFNAAAFSAS